MDSQGRSSITEFEARRQANTSSSAFHGYFHLALVVVLTLLTVGLAFAFGEQGGPSAVRLPLGFLFVFLLPGYALTSALFPKSGSGIFHTSSSFSVTALERLVLSVGLSLVVVPLISISIALLSVSITLASVLLGIGSFTLAMVLVAAVRTHKTLPQERYSIVSGVRRLDSGNWNKVQLTFAVMLVLAAAGLTAAVIGAGDGDTYSELAIHGEDDDGELVVGEYPDSLEETETLHVEIGNHEHQSVEYSVVVVFEELDSEDTIVEREAVDRFEVELDHTENRLVEHELEPTRTGESLRVAYLLYADDVPDQPDTSNADRAVHFFADVSE